MADILQIKCCKHFILTFVVMWHSNWKNTLGSEEMVWWTNSLKFQEMCCSQNHVVCTGLETTVLLYSITFTIAKSFSYVTHTIFTKKKASQGYTSHAYQFMEPDIASFDLICDAKQPLGLEFTNEQGAILITQWCHRIQSPALKKKSPQSLQPKSFSHGLNRNGVRKAPIFSRLQTFFN